MDGSTVDIPTPPPWHHTSPTSHEHRGGHTAPEKTLCMAAVAWRSDTGLDLEMPLPLVAFGVARPTTRWPISRDIEWRSLASPYQGSFPQSTRAICSRHLYTPQS